MRWTAFEKEYSWVIGAVGCLAVGGALYLGLPEQWAVPARYLATPTIDSNVIDSRLQAFDQLIGNYKETVAALDTLLEMLVLFSVLGLVVLVQTDIRKKKQQFEIPIISINVNADWLHVAVPAALLYSWLHFGFTLDDIIRQRIVLWDLLPTITGTSNIADFARENALNKPGFVDAWFTAFREGKHNLIVANPLHNQLAASLLFGFVLGFSHAVAMSMSVLGIERYQQRGGLVIIARILAFVTPTAFVLSHLVFLYQGRNPNTMQPVIAACAVVSTVLILGANPVEDSHVAQSLC